MRYRVNFSSFDKAAEQRRKTARIAVKVTLILLAGLMLYGVKKAFDMNAEVQRIRAGSAAMLDKIARETAERRKLIADEEAAAIENKMKFYGKMTEGRLYATTFFNILEEKTPRNISLKYVDFDASRKNFTLNGESFAPDSVAFYLPSLQSSSMIKKIQISRQSVQRVGERRQVVSDFDIRGETF